MHGTQAKQLRKLLIWEPLRSLVPTLLIIFFSLLLLGISQAGLLVLIGSFIDAVFKQETLLTSHKILQHTGVGFLAKVLALKTALDAFVLSNAWMLPSAIIVVGLIKAFSSYSFGLGQTVLALRWSDYLRRNLFRSIMGQTWQQTASRSPAHWMSILMNDVAFLQNKLSDAVTAFAKDGVSCLASLITLLFLHWPSGLVLLALAPILAFGFGRIARRIAWYAKYWQLELAKLSSAVLDIRERFPMIFSQGGQRVELHRFNRHVERYYETMRRSILLRSSLAPGMEWFGFLLLCSLYYVTGRKLWGAEFEAKHMFQVFAAAASIFKPLRNLGEQLTTFAELRGVMKPSLDLLKELAQTPQALPAKPTERLQILQVDLLTAGYRADRPEIRAESMRLQAGQCVAIVGPSGAGKSTLIRTYCGLLKPFEWVARATYSATHDLAFSWEQIGAVSTLVSQSPFLFSGTIRANLLYAWPLAEVPSDEAIWHSLRTVHLDEIVRQLSMQLDAKLSALQKSLSGGQIQRLLIARALLRPEQIIVCDEVTASLDSALEFEMTEVLCRHARSNGAILLFITHRLGQLQLFDMQWKISNGRLCQIVDAITN